MKNATVKSKSAILIAVMLTALFVFACAVCGVSLSAAGDNASDSTSALYTDNILAQAGISLSDNDKVVRTDGDGAVALTIIRAFDVKVVYGGQEFTVSCSGGTVSEAIKSAGITLSGAETVTPQLDAQVEDGTVINIVSDNLVTVIADGETKEINTKATTVGELLSELSITVGEDDILSTDANAAVTDNMTITIQRVEYKEETKTEVIDYGFVTEETDSLYLGESEIDTYGVEGEKEITYKCKYVDGELTDTEVISEKVIKEPVDQVELIGTYEEPEYEYEEPEYEEPQYQAPSVSQGAGTFTDINGNTVSYTKVLTGSATAYSANEGSYTATGVPVYQGGVAVNPNIIPYGTRLYIVASDGSVVYGYATAVDTGGALMSGEALVDVFYPSYSQCMEWGRRDVTVYILG